MGGAGGPDGNQADIFTASIFVGRGLETPTDSLVPPTGQSKGRVPNKPLLRIEIRSFLEAEGFNPQR